MEERHKYPLEQLVAIKKRRLEEAEKVLTEKKNALAKEEEKLASLELKRDEVKLHRDAKLMQFREKLDAGTTSDKIQQMKHYLKVVDEKLKVEDQKVKDQKKQVDTAEKQVEVARQDLFKKQKGIEKLKIHHKEWEAEMRELMEHREGMETDEMGGAMHIIKKRNKRHHSKKDKSQW